MVAVDGGWPPAYARAATTDGPVTTLTLRSPIPELDALTSAGHPFYRPDWGPNILGMIIEASTDWAEVAELVTESYRIQAPKKLAALVELPGAGS